MGKPETITPSYAGQRAVGGSLPLTEFRQDAGKSGLPEAAWRKTLLTAVV